MYCLQSICVSVDALRQPIELNFQRFIFVFCRNKFKAIKNMNNLKYADRNNYRDSKLYA